MSVDLHHGAWRARISVNRKRIELGNFADRDSAQRAYDEALARLGPTRVVKNRVMSDPAKRFHSKTKLDPETGCILWQAARSPDGYGKFQLNGGGKQRHIRAHRYAFFLRHGRWPHDMALHRCDTPMCVNPDHLEDGDQAKKVRDCVARGRHRYGRAR